MSSRVKMWSQGPWAYFDHGVGDIVVYSKNDESALCVFDCDSYAWPSDSYTVDGTAKANAALMASAPDMLDALEDAATFVDIESMDLSGRARESVNKLKDRIEAALSKAYGETNN